jgi:hypothetical protein
MLPAAETSTAVAHGFEAAIKLIVAAKQVVKEQRRPH